MTSIKTEPGHKKLTRIQREKRNIIQIAALNVFSEFGLRGATLDQIAQKSGLTKPNILYYYASKDEIYAELLKNLLEDWVAPLRNISPDGDPLQEILGYVRQKIRMSRDKPQKSKLFATEILHGAPRMHAILTGDLKSLVDEKARLIKKWGEQGRIAPIDPYHLIFSIWAMTQHYADFDTQVRSILGGEKQEKLYEEAEKFLVTLLTRGLTNT